MHVFVRIFNNFFGLCNIQVFKRKKPKSNFNFFGLIKQSNQRTTMTDKIHPVIASIDEKVWGYLQSLNEAELKNPGGRHRSIDGVTHVHPDRYTELAKMSEDYRIQLLESYIQEHC